jgi:hypothetical protein
MNTHLSLYLWEFPSNKLFEEYAKRLKRRMPFVGERVD